MTHVLSRRSILAAPLLVLVPTEADAQQDECASYYGRGYCTDYVNQRTGVRTRGDASRWPSNIGRISIEPGDVAIFRGRNHVAYIEEITEWGTRIPSARNRFPMRFRISEMNWGRLDRSAPASCIVTVNFGRVTSREGEFNDAEFMRVRRR